VLSWLSTLLSCHTREWQSSILLPCSLCDMGSKRRWRRWRLPHGFRAPDESDTTHLGESIGNYNISRSIERITRKIMWLITVDHVTSLFNARTTSDSPFSRNMTSSVEQWKGARDQRSCLRMFLILTCCFSLQSRKQVNLSACRFRPCLHTVLCDTIGPSCHINTLVQARVDLSITR